MVNKNYSKIKKSNNPTIKYFPHEQSKMTILTLECCFLSFHFFLELNIWYLIFKIRSPSIT